MFLLLREGEILFIVGAAGLWRPDSVETGGTAGQAAPRLVESLHLMVGAWRSFKYLYDCSLEQS